MRTIDAALPLLFPAFLLWLAVSLFVFSPLARYLHTRRPLAYFLLASLGLILLATLTPTNAALDGAGSEQGSCDLARFDLVAYWDWRAEFDPVVNVALFLPFGLALGLLPRDRRNLLIITAAFALTFAIELTQLLLTDLGRGCESADMIDNTLGLLIGLGFGSLARAIFSKGASDSG